MSYVLDALKKAQSQREKGGLPGINTMQLPMVPVANKPSSGVKPVLWFIAIVLTLILLVLGWRMMGSGAAQPEMAASPVPAPAAAPTQPPMPSPPSAMTMQAPATPANVPVAQAPVATASEHAAPKKKAAPAAESAKTESTKTEGGKAPMKALAKVDASGPANGPVAAGGIASETRIYAISELPESVQRELPSLSISGGSYSSNPAQRLLIVNNQVFTEHTQPVPGVTIEQIGQSSAVLSFRGYSYRVRY